MSTDEMLKYYIDRFFTSRSFWDEVLETNRWNKMDKAVGE